MPKKEVIVMKRIGVVVTLLFIGSLATYKLWPGTTAVPEVKVSANMKQKSSTQHALDDINEKAKRAKGGDLSSISDLADDILSRYGLLDSVPGTKEAIKERLVRAEMVFQKKGAAGVPEERVALMINELVAKLGAPDFMKTDAQQVRYVRVARMTRLPNLINQSIAAHGSASRKNTRASINSRLSPLEAMYIAMDLVYQKLNSDEFQMSPREFRANVNRKHLELSRRDRSSNSNQLPSESEYQVKQSAPTPKDAELRQAARRTTGMSGADFLSLANSALDTLGVSH